MKKKFSNLEKREIIEMYKKENISGTKIAEKFNCSFKPIYRILKEERVNLKGTKYFNKGKTAWNKNRKIDKKLYPNYGMKDKKHTIETKENMRLVKLGRESNSRRKDIDKRKEEILNLYNKKNFSIDKIAKLTNCSWNVIRRILKENNLKLRPTRFYTTGKHPSSNTEFKKMEEHPNWQDGKSFELYGIEFNKELKEKTRKRDNYICQECGKNQKELKRKLYIHHIDYCKQNNSSLNLISLCLKCHIKTNYNRKHWTNHFQMKMFIREFFNPQNLLIFNENKQLIGVERIK